jgi:phage pi2 protein 07
MRKPECELQAFTIVEVALLKMAIEILENRFDFIKKDHYTDIETIKEILNHPKYV